MRMLIPWYGVLFIAYVLQSSLLTAVAYNGITVDLIVLTAAFLSILYGRQAMLYGFSAGLFQDLASGTFLGMNAFILMCAAVVLSWLSQRFYKENIFLPLAAAVFVTIVDYVMTSLMIVLLGYSLNGWLVVNNMLTALIYNVVFAYPVYFTVIKIDGVLQRLLNSSRM